MQITVRYFARAREVTGVDTQQLELDGPCTVAQAFEALVRQHPGLADEATHLRFALGEAFVDGDAPLSPEATLVLIPPVGGG